MLSEVKRDLGSGRPWRHLGTPVTFEALPRWSKAALGPPPPVPSPSAVHAGRQL